MTSSLALAFVASATDGNVVHTAARAFESVAIDGRLVQSGALWFAIVGERDGHDFAAQAVERGASGVVLQRGRAKSLSLPKRVTVIEVDDTVRALGALARAHRRSFPSLRVIGVTGSNGKTTTKEMVAGILSAHLGRKAVHRTEGNFNNHLGLPLTLLKLHAGHRAAVIEMGMSARGEIAYLAALAEPEIGIITNVGPVHLETLGSIDEVAHAKGELFAALPARGVAIFPDGDARIAAQAAASPAIRQMRFGGRAGVEVRVVSTSIGASGTDVALRLPNGERVQATLPALGAQHGQNAAAAAAAAYALDVSADAIARGLGEARPAKHRSQVVAAGGRNILDDCYNASPLSTAAALETLAALKGGARGVAVLGDMLELGPDENLLHRNIGERAAQLGIDAMVTVGERARHAAAGALERGMPKEHVRHTRTVDEAAEEAARFSQPGDWILVKGSRGMQLERVVEALQTRFAASQQIPRSG